MCYVLQHWLLFSLDQSRENLQMLHRTYNVSLQVMMISYEKSPYSAIVGEKAEQATHKN